MIIIASGPFFFAVLLSYTPECYGFVEGTYGTEVEDGDDE